ncbi:hypothetical protein [Phytohabitans rumicis]|uniref:Uncharacterized protein n=1 Tax=Phytohabitans rumicis TaxID=1076125 RepID=A0A6V8L1P5_9ACTN|nr:hypothetical protein [Phytohabitans rumicis]GFJ90054.1 hypothetical protein Prum_036960 [Phytohabitans rumicis]
MAIEWTIESGSAVSPGQLVHATTKLLGAVLGTAPDGVRVEGDADDLTLRAAFGEAEGVAEISSDYEVDDLYVTVTAYRTQLSAAVALVTAVAVAELSGGELSGPGLARRYPAADLSPFIEDLPGGLAALATRFGWTLLPSS